MNIAANSVVAFHYTLTNSKGEMVDTSREGEPLPYLHGASNIVPGLEQALEGKTVGDKLQVEVPPQLGYGEYWTKWCNRCHVKCSPVWTP